jgi:hypothetical protein
MRAMIVLVGLTAGMFGLVHTAQAVPYDRATVRLGRAEPLLAVPSADTAPAAVPPRVVQRRERAA